MRCKCGFNSFDHHLACPKCHRDLTPTRRLLNLDIPAPGRVFFFQTAGQGMSVPPPFLGAAVGGDDFGEDIRPVEDIRPITFEANRFPPLKMTSLARPFLESTAFEAVLEEITPAPALAFADPAEKPMLENEIADDFEVDLPVSRPRTEAVFSPENPVPHRRHAVMDQIKSVLTETGDLNPKREPSAGEGRDGTSVARASRQTGSSDEEGDDDLSSLVGDLNLEGLEHEL